MCLDGVKTVRVEPDAAVEYPSHSKYSLATKVYNWWQFSGDQGDYSLNSGNRAQWHQGRADYLRLSREGRGLLVFLRVLRLLGI